MHLVFEQDNLVADWVAERMHGFERGEEFQPCTAIGISDGRQLVAGVVYNHFRAGNVEMSMCAVTPLWAQRRFLKVFFGYPFSQLECHRVTATAARKNRRARKMLAGLGFQLEGVIRKGYDCRQDAMIYGMLKHECKWIRN